LLFFAEDEHPHDHDQHQQPELLVAAQAFTRQDFLFLKGLGHEMNGIFFSSEDEHPHDHL
jgi:hypothetical protein